MLKLRKFGIYAILLSAFAFASCSDDSMSDIEQNLEQQGENSGGKKGNGVGGG